ncbi:MAG TPA: hypothetical protein PKD80_16445 [Microthrixaceae bacterium]|jgi:hypothetical protein|nr:hypothetical protein [Microthrixaceae bacterium]HMT23422.1 hypothetical protein [Microthrixaceae bacterium]
MKSVSAVRFGGALVLLASMLWAVDYLALTGGVLTVVAATLASVGVVMTAVGVVMTVVGGVRRTRR